jgi:hypothetical protein
MIFVSTNNFVGAGIVFSCLDTDFGMRGEIFRFLFVHVYSFLNLFIFLNFLEYVLYFF